MDAPPLVFLSYHQKDNKYATEHKVDELWNAVRKRYYLNNGKEMPQFRDVDDVRLSEDWATEIDSAVDHAAVMISIITSGYLQSPACRNELNRFLRVESDNTQRPLIPVIFGQVENLDAASPDPLLRRIARTQWLDMKEFAKTDVGVGPPNDMIDRVIEAVEHALTRWHPVQLIDPTPAFECLDVGHILRSGPIYSSKRLVSDLAVRARGLGLSESTDDLTAAAKLVKTDVGEPGQPHRYGVLSGPVSYGVYPYADGAFAGFSGEKTYHKERIFVGLMGSDSNFKGQRAPTSRAESDWFPSDLHGFLELIKRTSEEGDRDVPDDYLKQDRFNGSDPRYKLVETLSLLARSGLKADLQVVYEEHDFRGMESCGFEFGHGPFGVFDRVVAGAPLWAIRSTAAMP